MSKAYYIIFGLLLCLPIVIATAAIVYVCFKASLVAGFIALFACLIVIALIGITLIYKIKSSRREK